jgi:putative tryptophan/tyrosine transport system substrate-binding protein
MHDQAPTLAPEGGEGRVRGSADCARRNFLVALGTGVLAVGRRSQALAQPKVARVGFLYFGSWQSALDTRRYPAFVQGMRELGYIEGTNLVMEPRFADGNAERIPALAAELVRVKVDVIVATGGPVYRALQHAASGIPVVTTAAIDPVGDGLAATVARPGGNFTGLTLAAADLGPKLLDLLKTALPKASRVAVLLHPENVGHPPQLKRIMLVAQKRGIQTVVAEAGSGPEIEQAFAMIKRERANAVIILADSFLFQEARAIATQALKHRLPSIGGAQGFAEAGCLMSYGANLVENSRRAAAFVAKILKGAKPGDLPFEQPTRYYLVINLKTAGALGLTISPALLHQADEVIQ